MSSMRRKIWNLIRGGSFHGYLRTSSGYPLTLTGCMAEYPVMLSVSGNTVQDGTPTPDNPVEVQGVGDRTKNLSPISVVSPETVNICTQEYLQEGKTYTFSRVKDEGYAYTGYNLIIGAENTGYISGVTQLQRINVGNISADFHSVTFTAEASGYLWINGYATITAHYHDIMLNEGTEPLPYEPYGYKVPLVLSNSDGEPQTIPIYTDMPLYGNGTISDTVELDVRNRHAVRNKRVSIDESGNITQLATPVTTDISDMQDWDSIPKLWRGTAILTADTTIQPSDIAVKYYADNPGEEVS